MPEEGQKSYNIGGTSRSELMSRVKAQRSYGECNDCYVEKETGEVLMLLK